MTSPIVVGSVAVEIEASMRGFAKQLRAEITRQFKGAGLDKAISDAFGNQRIRVPVEVDRDRLAADLQALDRQNAGRNIRLPVSVSTSEVVRQARQAVRAAEQAIGSIQVRVNVDRSSLRQATSTLSRLGRTAGGLVRVAGALGAIGGAAGAGAAGLAGLASAAGGAVQLLAGLASAAATASGALLALPGGLSIAAAGIGTLALATSGLSEAFKASAKGGAALDEALKDLAPSAQRLVRQVVALRPAWEKMQRAVQERLFTGVADDLARLSGSILPTVRAGFVGVADVINNQLRNALAELSTANTRIRLAEIFDNARGALDNLTVAVRPLIRAFADVSAVGAGIVREQTTGLGRLIADVSARLSELAESGELRTLILDGIDMIKQLGAAAADVFGIVKGIFNAVPAGGGGLFALLDQLNTLVNSVQGQSALAELFANLARVGSALTPVLLAVVRALGPVSAAVAEVAVAFAPTLVTLVQSLGGALASLAPGFIALAPLVGALARGLQPLADILVGLVVGAAPGLTALVEGLVAGLQALAPAARPVGEALGAIGKAIAPLLPVIGAQLANVLTVVATLVSGLATEFTPLIEVFGEIATTAASALLPVLLQLAQQLLPVMAQAGVQIAQAFAPLIPVIAQMAQIFAERLAAALPSLISVFARLVPIVVSLAETIGTALLDALVQLLPHLPSLIDSGLQLTFAFVQLVAALYPILPSLVQLATLVAQAAINSGILQAAIVAMTVAVTAATTTVKLITGVINLLRAPLDAITAAAGRMGTAIRNGATSAYNAVKALPGRIRDAIGNAGRILYNAGRNVVQGLIDGIRSMFSRLGSTMSGVAETIRNYLPFSPAKEGPLSGSGNPYYSGQSIVELLAGGVRSNLGLAGSAAADLAAQFSLAESPAVGGLGSDASIPDPGRLVAEWLGGDGDPIMRAIREHTRIYYDGSAQKAIGTGKPR